MYDYEHNHECGYLDAYEQRTSDGGKIPKKTTQGKQQSYGNDPTQAWVDGWNGAVAEMKAELQEQRRKNRELREQKKNR